MGKAYLDVSVELLASFLKPLQTGPNEEVTISIVRDALPADAQVLGVDSSVIGNLRLILESKEWENREPAPILKSPWVHANFRPANYVEQALQTESVPSSEVLTRLSDPQTVRLIHTGMGLVTEAAEFLDQLKKHIFYGKPLDKVNLAEEIGDGFWYAAIGCDVMGTSFEQIQERNIAKLRARYPNKFTEYDAEHRDLDMERKILESNPNC